MGLEEWAPPISARLIGPRPRGSEPRGRDPPGPERAGQGPRTMFPDPRGINLSGPPARGSYRNPPWICAPTPRPGPPEGRPTDLNPAPAPAARPDRGPAGARRGTRVIRPGQWTRSGRPGRPIATAPGDSSPQPPRWGEAPGLRERREQDPAVFNLDPRAGPAGGASKWGLGARGAPAPTGVEEGPPPSERHGGPEASDPGAGPRGGRRAGAAGPGRARAGGPRTAAHGACSRAATPGRATPGRQKRGVQNPRSAQGGATRDEPAAGGCGRPAAVAGPAPGTGAPARQRPDPRPGPPGPDDRPPPAHRASD